MSEIAQYLREAVREYVHGRIDVEQFREAFVGAYGFVRNNASRDVEAARIASNVMGPWAEFAAGYRSETSLRDDLETILYPRVTFRTYDAPQPPTKAPKTEYFEIRQSAVGYRSPLLRQRS